MRSILAAVAAPTIARCIATSAVTAQTPKQGGMLEFAVVAEPPSDDCHGSTTFALIDPVAPHDSLLVKFDGKEYPRVVQDLVESWTVSPLVKSSAVVPDILGGQFDTEFPRPQSSGKSAAAR